MTEARASSDRGCSAAKMYSSFSWFQYIII